ncbi:hypothetical protein [Aliikangiella coralliicola]|uniref:Uncharacterized protein n=1 Tax=Aliikangiella coralliicola TaxID=2592383 RepID=A0A545UCL2_9GAMM|nr:hypothetical protein [Aliikangiella coralliicola]TQV87163.1 hypothetical protein FLL46_15275 [Aliikangiella coralliicola]
MSNNFPNIPNVRFVLFERKDYPEFVSKNKNIDESAMPIIAVSSDQHIWCKRNGKWFRLEECVRDDGWEFVQIRAVDSPLSFIMPLGIEDMYNLKFGDEFNFEA